MMPFMQDTWHGQIHRQKIEWWLPEAGGMESYCLIGTEFCLGKMNSEDGMG